MTLTQTKQELRLGNDADLNEIGRISTEHVAAFNFRHDSTGQKPLLRYVDALIGRRQQARRRDALHVIVWIEEVPDDLSLSDYDLIEQARDTITTTITSRYRCSVNVNVDLPSE